MWNIHCDVAGFFDEAGSTVEKEFHKVANALSYEYRFAHSSRRHVYERYDYRKYVLFQQTEYF